MICLLRRHAIVLTVGLLVALSAPSARAAMMIIAEETGGDVVFTFSGSIDTTGAIPFNEFELQTALDPTFGEIEAWQTTTDTISMDLLATIPFGPGSAIYDVAVGAGDNIGVFGNELFLDDDYVSNTPLNATLTFSGATFASLGVDAAGGPYVWTLIDSGDTITMRFPQAEADAAAKAAIAALAAPLQSKIKKLQKKAKKLKKKGQKAKAKKLLKKVKKLKKQLAAL